MSSIAKCFDEWNDWSTTLERLESIDINMDDILLVAARLPFPTLSHATYLGCNVWSKKMRREGRGREQQIDHV